MPKSKTTEQFVHEAVAIHGDKYNYDSVVYKNNRSKVLIFCKFHNEYFEQAPLKHLGGQGCKKCGAISRGMNKRLTTEEFIKRSRKKHGDFYDYSQSKYVKQKTKTIIICPIHGPFSQCPSAHIYGMGCNECAKERQREMWSRGWSEFVILATEAHSGRYGYPEQEYINGKTPVRIHCEAHGEFNQTPECHILRSHGCPKCAHEKAGDYHRLNNDSFAKKAKAVHGDKYDYSNVSYLNNHTDVSIVCEKHGEFKQKPGNHLSGMGCRECGTESKCGTHSIDAIKGNKEKESLPCVFYHVRMTNPTNGNVFDKVGVTTTKVMHRFSLTRRAGFDIEIINQYNSTLIDCLELEELVLNELKEDSRLYKVHDLKMEFNGWRLGGWTECYKSRHMV